MTDRRLLIAALLTLTFITSGCGDGDSTVEPEPSGSTELGQSEEGLPAERGAGSDSSTVDADIAIPIAPEADAVATSESGPLTIVQFIVPLNRLESTIEFYDDWTGAQPDSYQRIAVDTGGVSWQNSPEAGADRNLIAVLSPIEGDAFVTVTLSSGPLE